VTCYCGPPRSTSASPRRSGGPLASTCGPADTSERSWRRRTSASRNSHGTFLDVIAPITPPSARCKIIKVRLEHRDLYNVSIGNIFPFCNYQCTVNSNFFNYRLVSRAISLQFILRSSYRNCLNALSFGGNARLPLIPVARVFLSECYFHAILIRPPGVESNFQKIREKRRYEYQDDERCPARN